MGIRGGRVDSRRRRVLLEDAQQNEETVRRPRSRRRTEEAVVARSYSQHADAQRQPRVTDLIPTRWWTLFVLSLVLLTVAVAVYTLHLFALVHGRSGQPGWSALALQFGGTLSGWVCSTLLLVGCTYSGLVYVVRRHKTDDYRGRYRIWVWIAAAFLLASILPTANPGPVVKDQLLTAGLTSSAVLDQAVPWSLGLLLITAAVRIGFEVRRCRAAMTLLVLATLAFLTALVWPRVQLPVTVLISDLVGSSAGLIGVMALTSTSVLFARYVYLDSQGRLSSGREAASEVASEIADKVADEVAEGDESEPISRRPANKRRSRAVSTRATVKPEELESGDTDSSEPEMYEEEEDESQRKPTKAERRRLRKQRRKAA